eukprot:gene2709-2959_t
MFAARHWQLRRSLRSSKPIRDALRRLSQDSSKAAELSTEEKAGEIGKDVWKFIRKYGVLIVPGTVLVVVSVDIINKPHHRDWLEERCPLYVKLMREYYGFSDEDTQERARLDLMRRVLAKKVKVRVRLEGVEQEVEVEGGRSVADLVAELFPNRSFSPATLYSSHLLSFLDDSEEEEIQKDESVSKTKQEEEGSQRGVVEGSLWASSSLWTPLQPSSSLADYLTTHPLDEKALRWQFGSSLLHSLFAGWRSYSQHAVLGLRVLQKSGWVQEGVAGGGGGRASSRVTVDRNQEKQLALQRVAALEGRLQALRDELARGRSADDVEHETLALRREIAQIRRNHINTFYFF